MEPVRRGGVDSKKIFLAVALVFLFSLFVYGFPSYKPAGGLGIPSQVGEFRLAARIEGEEAMRSVQKLHIGSVENVKDSVIAVYQGPSDSSMHLWVAGFSSAGEAGESLTLMVNAMATHPELGFEPTDYSLSGVHVYRAVRGGEVNIFWAQDRYVFYVLLSGVSADESDDITRDLIATFE